MPDAAFALLVSHSLSHSPDQPNRAISYLDYSDGPSLSPRSLDLGLGLGLGWRGKEGWARGEEGRETESSAKGGSTASGLLIGSNPKIDFPRNFAHAG